MKRLLSILAPVFLLLCGFNQSYADDKIAPAIQAVDLNGQPINLQDYQGKVVYLDFWASWCPPCAKSFPELNQLYNELKEEGFEIIALSVDKHKKDLDKFLEKHPVDFLIAWDKKGISPERYHVQTMPSGFLIDRQGIMRYKFRGFKQGSEQKIKQYAQMLLDEKATSATETK